jgi:hypothetical protein
MPKRARPRSTRSSTSPRRNSSRRAWPAPASTRSPGRATKRKIYYYFEGKDDLYRAVLERAYRRVRESENQVDIEGGTALEALRRLIEHDVRYHSQHPELVRLVMNENIHRAEHLKQIAQLPGRNQAR